MGNIKKFNEISLVDYNQVGGKNASLGEMIKNLSGIGIKVPDGFAITTAAYTEFLAQNNQDHMIYKILDRLDINDVEQLQKTSLDIQRLIKNMELPDGLVTEVAEAYALMRKNDQECVAVRSSATAEDLVDSSFAGQQESFLNIVGIDNILQAIKEVYASLFTSRAIAYRKHCGFDHASVGISVGIQRMVRSDLSISGVVFTLDTESGFEDVVFITASYGLGECIVQGTVNPDEFLVHKPMLLQNKSAIIRRSLGSKLIKKICNSGGNRDLAGSLETAAVPELEQRHFCLSDKEIHELAHQAIRIENHYKRPMDIEWAKDGIDNQIYILQARPETVKSQKQDRNIVEYFRLTEKGQVKASGRSIGDRIGQGNAKIILDPIQMGELRAGEVLVTDMTDPDWEPIMKRAGAIVTNRGGRTCHAAIIARELGIPAVIGCGDASEKINQGEPITVSCAEGETGYVYSGILSHLVEKIVIDELPELPVKICMNLGDPEKALYHQAIPNDGVGLARLEFIISTMIGIHPKALLNFQELPVVLQREISAKTGAYSSPLEFYTTKLTEGISTIAAAFYPKPVIVRFSDFKSNEYANLLGGGLFEVKEENPMLGYRGASRYLASDFRECFELECQAIKHVRDVMGFINTKVMIPFVRTVEEASQVIELLNNLGLSRGKNDLEVYMMCEIPSNVLLAEQFLEYFDGFSIGSNDLTQLTLGLDRDSSQVAHLFDERNAALKVLLQRVIKVCHEAGKYIGICGQGPSDHPDFAKWLMEQGITSISLTPDSIIPTWLFLGSVRAKN
jgi:pyruvate, water dikinase